MKVNLKWKGMRNLFVMALCLCVMLLGCPTDNGSNEDSNKDRQTQTNSSSDNGSSSDNSSSSDNGSSSTVLVTRIRIFPTLSYHVGDGAYIGGKSMISIEPNNATDQSVTWSSDNPDVVSVDNEYLHAVSPGTAVITVTANDGSGVSATCTVTVMGDDE